MHQLLYNRETDSTCIGSRGPPLEVGATLRRFRSRVHGKAKSELAFGDTNITCSVYDCLGIRYSKGEGGWNE